MDSRLEKLRDSTFVFGLCNRMSCTVLRSRHEPKLFRLPGSSKVPQAIVCRYYGIARFVNNEQWPRADFANHIYRSDLVYINVSSEVGDADSDGRKGKCWEMNELFETGGDHARRVAESGI